MKIGIDLDNTITAYPHFFEILTKSLAPVAEIYIITSRGEDCDIVREDTIIELRFHKITFHHLIITSKKADYILKNGINVFIDDTDEYFQALPESVCVLKIREMGNFDFASKRWIYGNKTGLNIDNH